MKLELKHIAPYLPYDLECECPSLTEDREVPKVCDMVGAFSDWVAISTKDSNVHDEFEYDEFKPLLRPLKDLSTEIEHNGKRFVPCIIIAQGDDDYFTDEDNCLYRYTDCDRYNYERVRFENIVDINAIEWWIMQDLIKWHFDISQLLESDLAIEKQAIK